jgi:hypothetical protein
MNAVSLEQGFKDLVKLCGFDGAESEKLWATSATVLGAATPALVESLTRAAFGTASAGDPSLAKLQAQFSEAGVTLNWENSQSLHVACAGLLMRMLASTGALPTQAALSITTAACGGARKPVASLNLIEQAESAIDRASLEGRKRPDIAIAKLAAPSVGFTKIRPLLETLNADTVDSGFKNAAGEINTALKKLLQDVVGTLAATQRVLVMQDEELQHLWWLIGGRSVEGKALFKDIDKAAKPIVLAHELAGMTQLSPGPTSLRALFARAGVTDSKLTIPDAVNACSIEWVRSYGEREDISSLTSPLHTAIARRAETGEKGQWEAGWHGATNIGTDHKVSGVEMAALFFRERLLRRHA